MNKYLKGILVFVSWLLLILVMALFGGNIYKLFLGIPSGLWIVNPDLLIYLIGIMSSYIFITTIFFFIFIGNYVSRYVFSIIISLPIFLFDFIAGDPIKFLLDLVNLLIAMGIGSLIIFIYNKARRRQKLVSE